MVRRLRPTPVRRRDVAVLDAEDERGGAPLDVADHSFVLEPLRRGIEVVILGVIDSIARRRFPMPGDGLTRSCPQPPFVRTGTPFNPKFCPIAPPPSPAIAWPTNASPRISTMRPIGAWSRNAAGFRIQQRISRRREPAEVTADADLTDRDHPRPQRQQDSALQIRPLALFGSSGWVRNGPCASYPVGASTVALESSASLWSPARISPVSRIWGIQSQRFPEAGQ